MLGWRLLAIPLVGLALLGVTSSAADSPDAAITSAAVAPYRDELLRDTPALCSDLTRPPTIVPTPPPGESCEQAVQSVWADAAPPSVPREAALSLRASASHLEIDENHATGLFSLIATIQQGTTAPGIVSVGISSLGRYRLSLEKVAGRWLVSSPARLAAVDDCQLKPHSHCSPGVKDVVFILGLSVPPTPEEGIPTPKAVRRAGSRERAEFAAGRTVLAHTGCLACHEIDEEGNPGPGQNLTHIGAQLSPRQIEHAVLSPRAPMPSFKRLPATKLHDLIRFLSLMR